MSGVPRRTAPAAPFRVWLLTVGLVGVLGGWLLHDDFHAVFEPLAGGEPRIIGFGDSSLHAATYEGRWMNQFAQAHGLAGLHFLRVSPPNGYLGTVRPLLEPAIASRPDVLLIQTWLLICPPDERYKQLCEQASAFGLGEALARTRLAVSGGTSRLHRAAVTRTLRGWADGGSLLVAPTEPPARCSPESRQYTLERNAARWPANPPPEVTPGVRTSLEGLLDRARDEGVRVVFLDVPRIQEIETLPGVREKRRSTRALLEKWVSEGRAEYLRVDSIPPDQYCDGVHLTRAGTIAYTRWLLGELGFLASL